MEEKSVAEMWMGDHPSGRNMIKVQDELLPFHDLIISYPKEILGNECIKKFGPVLPFLFKLLAAEKPLSIQAHPDKVQAESGFERENILNISMKDYTRGYKDKNHKPEIILALTDFIMMKGFMEYGIIYENFREYCGSSSEILFSEKGINPIKDFFNKIIYSDRHSLEIMIREALKNTSKKDNLISELIIKFSRFYPEDPGILSPLFLNSTVLKVGEAVFIPAGELHAYVNGTGIELMSNSDNVFRGGLTNKHVDREELLEILSYKPSEIIKVGKVKSDCETFFPTSSDEFLLSEIKINPGDRYISRSKRNIEIIFCYSGGAAIETDEKNYIMSIKKGDSFFIPSALADYTIRGEGVFYKATVPL